MRIGRCAVFAMVMGLCLGSGMLSQSLHKSNGNQEGQMLSKDVYGGFFFGTGFFFLLFARHEAWFRPGLIAQASIFGGFVLGRTVGIAIGGAPNLFIMALLVGEIAGLLVALVLLRQLSRSTRAQ